MIAAAFGLPLTVHVHERGLLVCEGPLAFEKRTYAIPFDEIDAVFLDFDALFDAAPEIVLVTFDGERTVLPNDLADIRAILGVIDRKVTTRITDDAKKALARGERLTFGPLVLELDGIVLEGQSLCWSDLSRVVAEDRALVFYAHEPRGRFGWVRICDLPHPRALLDVLRMRTNVVMRGLPL